MIPEPTATGATERRRIVVFSDGTGNSSAKLFKTNVWRLYEAVDTRRNAGTRQLVAYDDGVGTSTFKPLALLGGAFGVGLMRNVLDLYRFICRNYQDGDEIYAFGFSRGAFTIRVLVGLLTMIGVIRPQPDSATLNMLTNDAYREFRQCFKLQGGGWLHRQTVARLRKLRDRSIKWWRKTTGRPYLKDADKIELRSIAFVGVWDTVAAYGFPIAEITKGIDQWVWPLSMPDYKLSAKVYRARHALALDDERDTFHPLLWDEVHEDELISKAACRVTACTKFGSWACTRTSAAATRTIRSSYVSLMWMIDEAEKAGLKLQQGDGQGVLARKRIRSGRSTTAVRASPRTIAISRVRSARGCTRRIRARGYSRPRRQGPGLLTHVRLHQSVIERIVRGTDGYSPIVLPAEYSVEGGLPASAFGVARGGSRTRLGPVWYRRVGYFVTLGLTFGLLAVGFMPPPARAVSALSA